MTVKELILALLDQPPLAKVVCDTPTGDFPAISVSRQSGYFESLEVAITCRDRTREEVEK